MGDRDSPDSWKSSLLQLTWFTAREQVGLEYGDEPASHVEALVRGAEKDDPLVQRLFLARISELQAAAAAVRETVEQGVVEAAKVGANYTQIGEALGVSKQAARKQYRHLVEAARHSDEHLDNLPLQHTTADCRDRPCARKPEVLLASLSGSLRWYCVAHAADRLNVSGYIAAESRKGVARKVVEQSRSGSA